MLRSLLITLAILTTTTAAFADNIVRIKELKVLAVIYRGAEGADDRMSEHDITRAKNGLELGRLFYFRNSRAQLNVALHWLIFDRTAPENAGPTMANMEEELRAHGIRDGQYDGLIVTGVGLKGNWGGFNVLGGAGGCFGIGGFRGTGYPEFDDDTGYGWAWIFAHEFQHALDLVIVESSELDMLHSHPYVDREEEFFRGYYKGGEHWDWIAVTLREFDDYLSIKGMTGTILDCVDADRDGLADDDPRLPADEKRFGSDPHKADTDGDGLNDLGEFIANRFAGSDPRAADTDGDGLTDDVDPYPCVAIRPTLTYLSTTQAQPELLLDSVFVRSDGGGDVAVYGGWNEEGLRLWFEGPRAFKVHMKLDGSAANGFWEGGDTYVIRAEDGRVRFAGLGLSGDIPGAHAKHIPSGPCDECLLEVYIPARLGQGVSKEINYGGPREPQDVVDGLTLAAGRSIGFNFILEFEDGSQAVLTPHHSMFATRLLKPTTAPDHPMIRGAKVSSDPIPVVQVLGVSGLHKVEVVHEGTVLGARVGPGPVRLVELDEDGTFALIARTSEAESEPFELRVDRHAAPPALLQQDQKLVVRDCEPGATVELWWGVADTPVAPVAGAQADQSGSVAFEAGRQLDYLTGWVVTAYRDIEFVHEAYVTAWQKIDHFFKGGSPDPRLPGDGFAFRCEGLLKVDIPGEYTFELNTDDGSRLFINDEVVLDHWGHHAMSPRLATVHLTEGLHPIRIDYYEEFGWAGFKFRYAPPNRDLTFDVPILRAPWPVHKLDFFAVQTDRLGNRSGFTQVPN